MSDLISRQVAIDALGEAPKYKPRIFKTYKEGRSDQWFDDVAKLSLLPSVENKGEWISEYDEDGKTGWYECSCCHSERAFNTNFCPNCGADMRGE